MTILRKILVNGEDYVEIPRGATAGELKQAYEQQTGNSVQSGWKVFGKTPAGSMGELSDSDVIGDDVERVSINPPPRGGGFGSSERQRLLGRLETEAAYLQHNKGYGNVTVDDYGNSGVVVYIPRFPLPSGWNKGTVAIAIEIPTRAQGYPTLQPDWFYVEKDIRWRNGRKPDHLFNKGGGLVPQDLVDAGFGKYSFHIGSWQPVTSPHRHFTDGDSLVSFCDAITVLLSQPDKA